jgi:hypothetical protein
MCCSVDYKETRIQDWIAWMNHKLQMKEGKDTSCRIRYEEGRRTDVLQKEDESEERKDTKENKELL